MPPTKGPLVVTWTTQVCAIMLCVLFIGATMIRLQFVIVPLILAYFVTFLMAPVLDLMEKRPYQCGGPCGEMPEEPSDAETAYEVRLLCEGGFEHERRISLIRQIAKRDKYAAPDQTTSQLTILNLVLMGKVPHVVACLLTLVISFSILFFLFWLVADSFSSFGHSETIRTKPCELGRVTTNDGFRTTYTDTGIVCGGTPMSQQLVTVANEFVDVTLAEQGIKIRKDFYCAPNDEKIALMQELDADNNWIVNTYVYGVYAGESQKGEYMHKGANQTVEMCLLSDIMANGQHNCCDEIPLFGSGDGTEMDDIVSYGLIIAYFCNEAAVVMLLAIYILLERPEGSTFSLSNRVALLMEAMVKNYIGLKTALSFVTGVLTAVFMLLCSIKLAVIWGLLAFLFNYIPNVGSMIACCLPIPVIMLDPELAGWQKACGFLGPGMVQMYVGNFLEPAVFGKSLNLTALSVLLALVFFAYLWGLSGAVLSVPLLGALKIICHDTDHPMAKTFLVMIREEAEVDDENDELLDRWLDRMEDERKRLDKLFHFDEELGDQASDWEHTPHHMSEHMFGFKPEMHHHYTKAAVTIQSHHRRKQAQAQVEGLRSMDEGGREGGEGSADGADVEAE